jgi:hypothetical protein
MSSIKGTNVLAPVVPFDTVDAYPSHVATYGKGGYRSVLNTSERDGIPTLRREAGMLVWVTSLQKEYRLDADLVTWIENTTSVDQQIINGGDF